MRHGFRRAFRLVRFNWPLYVFGAAVVVIALAMCASPGLTPLVRALAGLAAAFATWFAAASFLAFHWMFDRSDLLRGTWLQEEVRRTPSRLLTINAGLDETTLPVRALFPEASVEAVDIYDARVMTEPALSRARGNAAAGSGLSALPDASADVMLVMLAAHEIRDVGRREHLFRELRRVTTDDGEVLLVEHLRDLAAALAFGPGLFHFLPRREWLRLAALSGFSVVRERAITPFVRVFVLRPKEPRT